MNWLSKDLTWLVLAGLALVLFVALQRFASRRGDGQYSVERDTTQAYGRTARDPVTGGNVDVTHAITANFEGKTYFFESENSRTVFQRDPARYAHQHHRHRGFC